MVQPDSLNVGSKGGPWRAGARWRAPPMWRSLWRHRNSGRLSWWC